MSKSTAEELLTIPEIASKLRIDRHVVTTRFKDEPGVINLGTAETVKGRRHYAQLRVPVSVYNRVMARMTVRSR